MSGYIYFIGALGSGAVKLGFSSGNPKKRLRAMQTGNSDKLILLGFFNGTLDEEKRLHVKFSPYCIRGEWYRLEGEFKDFFEAFDRIFWREHGLGLKEEVAA